MNFVEESRVWPVALTIAGSDSGGGAGIQADLKTFHGNGVYGVSAITCLTAQNPDGVTGVQPMSADFVLEQIRQVHAYFDVRAIKTGMLFNEEIVLAVAGFLRENPDLPVIVDPVMVATSGAVLLEESAIEAIKRELLPKASLITPNLDEAEVLLGWKPRCSEEMKKAAEELVGSFDTSVLLKGGHLEESLLTDWLVSANGFKRGFNQDRIFNINTHGSGCTLASAIAAQVALGRDLQEAASAGLAYLQRSMQSPLLVNGTFWIAH